jgi:hypothetical protein
MTDQTQKDQYWDDAEMFSADDFVKFEVVGSSVTGTITAIKRHRFDDGKVVPQLELDTADGPKTLTAGQFRLKQELRELRPGVGDQITITYTKEEKLTGGKTLKHFSVIVGPQPQAAPAPAPAAQAMPADHAMAPQFTAAPAAAPAFDPASLTAEQLAALLAAKGVA